MKTRTYQEVRKSVEDKGYVWFSDEMDPNFIFERTSNEYTNGFTDLLHICYMQEGREMIQTFRCTTKPGLYGKGAIMSDAKSSSGGATGTASVIPGQYRGAWKMKYLDKLLKGPDVFTGSPHYVPCMHQVGKLKIARDNNKDLVINPDLKKTEGSGYGINFHYMGSDETPNIFKDDKLNNWSIGCFGAPKKTFYKIMMVMAACAQFSGKSVSLTLLETKDFG